MPAPSPSPIHSQAKLSKIAKSVCSKWRGLRGHDEDLQQEAELYRLTNEQDQWFILDLKQHLHDYGARWCYQSARPSTKGLRVLEAGVLHMTWMSPPPPSPEGQALARIELERVWARSTKGQKKAIQALALGEQDHKQGILSSELSAFDIPNSDAFHERLRSIRKEGHA